MGGVYVCGNVLLYFFMDFRMHAYKIYDVHLFSIYSSFVPRGPLHHSKSSYWTVL